MCQISRQQNTTTCIIRRYYGRIRLQVKAVQGRWQWTSQRCPANTSEQWKRYEAKNTMPGQMSSKNRWKARYCSGREAEKRSSVQCERTYLLHNKRRDIKKKSEIRMFKCLYMIWDACKRFRQLIQDLKCPYKVSNAYTWFPMPYKGIQTLMEEFKWLYNVSNAYTGFQMLIQHFKYLYITSNAYTSLQMLSTIINTTCLTHTQKCLWKHAPGERSAQRPKYWSESNIR